MMNTLKWYFSNRTVKLHTQLQLIFGKEIDPQQIEKEWSGILNRLDIEIEDPYISSYFILKNLQNKFDIHGSIRYEKQYMTVDFIVQISSRDLEKTWSTIDDIYKEMVLKIGGVAVYKIILRNCNSEEIDDNNLKNGIEIQKEERSVQFLSAKMKPLKHILSDYFKYFCVI